MSTTPEPDLDEPHTPLNTTDQEMIEHPEWWPANRLFLKRRSKPDMAGYDELASIVPHSLIVRFTPACWRTGSIEYDSAEQMVEDGWLVD